MGTTHTVMHECDDCGDRDQGEIVTTIMKVRQFHTADGAILLDIDARFGTTEKIEKLTLLLNCDVAVNLARDLKAALFHELAIDADFLREVQRLRRASNASHGRSDRTVPVGYVERFGADEEPTVPCIAIADTYITSREDEGAYGYVDIHATFEDSEPGQPDCSVLRFAPDVATDAAFGLTGAVIDELTFGSHELLAALARQRMATREARDE